MNQNDGELITRHPLLQVSAPEQSVVVDCPQHGKVNRHQLKSQFAKVQPQVRADGRLPVPNRRSTPDDVHRHSIDEQEEELEANHVDVANTPEEPDDRDGGNYEHDGDVKGNREGSAPDAVQSLGDRGGGKPDPEANRPEHDKQEEQHEQLGSEGDQPGPRLEEDEELGAKSGLVGHEEALLEGEGVPQLEGAEEVRREEERLEDREPHKVNRAGDGLLVGSPQCYLYGHHEDVDHHQGPLS